MLFDDCRGTLADPALQAQPQFSGARFSGAQFSGARFSGARFSVHVRRKPVLRVHGHRLRGVRRPVRRAPSR
ncbi:pentapeptide repeat-containing protein [Arthrobacter sp. TB 26]|uniref:pentapeptide repeat-containing protein n=1 Tax=Arthrobacter sp. TB 26 TaxID=494420 RepID=UPI003A5C28CB